MGSCGSYVFQIADSILVAIGDPNLLNLLLAYSASHRARYLGHPEPANRIAHWVRDVFPTLRFALESSHEEITDSHLATAILLLSLKIVSPGTFEVPITWQSHLKLARDLFLARSERISRLGNQIGAFFARWLGYIDTVGALSCRQAGRPLMMYHSVLAACVGSDNYDEFRVDCFTGFSPRTGLLLIRLARLVQECDHERFDELGNFRHDWHLSADRIMEAEAILEELEGLSERVHIDSEHHTGVEGEDMLATEKAFRSAGLIYLHRRVLGTPSDSYPVKEALSQLSDALSNMTLCASLCCLLPLFTLAVEATPDRREELLERFSELEKCGMKQVSSLRQEVKYWQMTNTRLDSRCATARPTLLGRRCPMDLLGNRAVLWLATLCSYLSSKKAEHMCTYPDLIYCNQSPSAGAWAK